MTETEREMERVSNNAMADNNQCNIIVVKFQPSQMDVAQMVRVSQSGECRLSVTIVCCASQHMASGTVHYCPRSCCAVATVRGIIVESDSESGVTRCDPMLKKHKLCEPFFLTDTMVVILKLPYWHATAWE